MLRMLYKRPQILAKCPGKLPAVQVIGQQGEVGRLQGGRAWSVDDGDLAVLQLSAAHLACARHWAGAPLGGEGLAPCARHRICQHATKLCHGGVCGQGIKQWAAQRPAGGHSSTQARWRKLSCAGARHSPRMLLPVELLPFPDLPAVSEQGISIEAALGKKHSTTTGEA